MRTIMPAIAVAFAVLFVATAGAQMPDCRVLAAGQVVTFDAMVYRLAAADVVFVGEEHDHRAGHEIELALLEALYARHPRMAVSLEMFERDTQLVLDEYLTGDITEASYLAASRPWPNYKTDYRPLVEFCREHHLPVVAANAPRRYVNMVSRGGQDSLARLPRSSLSYLAPLPYSMDLPPGYDTRLGSVLGQAHGGSASAQPAAVMPTLDHMKQAQGLWDATMADTIARFARSHRGVPVLQINGAMHSDHGYGIVDRLRHLAPRLKIAIVSIVRDDSYPDPPSDFDASAGDFVILAK